MEEKYEWVPDYTQEEWIELFRDSIETIKEQQKEIEKIEEENKQLREHRDNLNSIIFDMDKEITRWKRINQDLVSTYSNRNEILREENKILQDNLTTAQRLKQHLDENGKEYYTNIIEETNIILDKKENR